MPIDPVAPATFSTTTLIPFSPRMLDKARAEMSFEPPAFHGTIRRISLLGKVACASTGAATVSATNDPSSERAMLENMFCFISAVS
jgi:hypothetical protein